MKLQICLAISRDRVVDGIVTKLAKYKRREFATLVAQKTLANRVVEADPTTTFSYTTWITKQLLASSFPAEDLPQVRDTLAIFHRRKVANELPAASRNVDKLTWPQVQQLTADNSKFVSLPELLRTGKHFYPSQAELLHHDSRCAVVLVKTVDASRHFGRGTVWCTARTDEQNLYQHYSKRNNTLYYCSFFAKSPPDCRVAFVFGPDQQFPNEANHFLSEHDQLALVEHYPVLKRVFGAVARQHSVLWLMDVQPSDWDAVLERHGWAKLAAAVPHLDLNQASEAVQAEALAHDPQLAATITTKTPVLRLVQLVNKLGTLSSARCQVVTRRLAANSHVLPTARSVHSLEFSTVDDYAQFFHLDTLQNALPYLTGDDRWEVDYSDDEDCVKLITKLPQSSRKELEDKAASYFTDTDGWDEADQSASGVYAILREHDDELVVRLHWAVRDGYSNGAHAAMWDEFIKHFNRDWLNNDPISVPLSYRNVANLVATDLEMPNTTIEGECGSVGAWLMDAVPYDELGDEMQVVDMRQPAWGWEGYDQEAAVESFRSY